MDSLVLERRGGEAVVIGDDITITLLSITGNRAKILFECPNHIKILREELVGKDQK